MDIEPLVFTADQMRAAEQLAQMCREIEREIFNRRLDAKESAGSGRTTLGLDCE